MPRAFLRPSRGHPRARVCALRGANRVPLPHRPRTRPILTERSSHWRAQALRLVEYLVHNGSDRFVEDAQVRCTATLPSSAAAVCGPWSLTRVLLVSAARPLQKRIKDIKKLTRYKYYNQESEDIAGDGASERVRLCAVVVSSTCVRPVRKRSAHQGRLSQPAARRRREAQGGALQEEELRGARCQRLPVRLSLCVPPRRAAGMARAWRARLRGWDSLGTCPVEPSDYDRDRDDRRRD
jgi:hypothetical protein